jgi:hypothetical protein
MLHGIRQPSDLFRQRNEPEFELQVPLIVRELTAIVRDASLGSGTATVVSRARLLPAVNGCIESEVRNVGT